MRMMAANMATGPQNQMQGGGYGPQNGGYEMPHSHSPYHPGYYPPQRDVPDVMDYFPPVWQEGEDERMPEPSQRRDRQGRYMMAGEHMRMGGGYSARATGGKPHTPQRELHEDGERRERMRTNPIWDEDFKLRQRMPQGKQHGKIGFDRERAERDDDNDDDDAARLAAMDPKCISRVEKALEQLAIDIDIGKRLLKSAREEK